jgi:Ribbon-helix-helix protein, copG family
MRQQTTIRLPSDLLKRARRNARAEGRSLTSLIEDALKLVTGEQPKTQRKRPVQLPVSEAMGGPGIEGLSYSEIEAIEDLEYMERMKGFK